MSDERGIPTVFSEAALIRMVRLVEARTTWRQYQESREPIRLPIRDSEAVSFTSFGAVEFIPSSDTVFDRTALERRLEAMKRSGNYFESACSGSSTLELRVEDYTVSASGALRHQLARARGSD